MNQEYLDNNIPYGKGKSSYFVLGGVLLTVDLAGQLTEKIIKMKEKYFGTKDVKLYSIGLCTLTIKRKGILKYAKTSYKVIVS